MDFLEKEDFKSLIDDVTLSTITEDDDALLDEAEGRSIEEMKAYLSIRYDVEEIFNGDIRSGLVVMYLCDMVLYHLHARIAPDNIPTLRHNRYENAMDWLNKIADGYINPLLPSKKSEDKIPLRYGSQPKQPNFY